MEESINYKELDEALETLNASEELETINEVTLQTNQYFGLGMDPDPNHQPGYALDPYVKIFNNPSYHKATKSIDVSITKGIAFHHPRDRKPKLEFKEGGWKRFLDEAIRKVINPASDSVIFNAEKYYSFSDLSKGARYIEGKKPYRVYEQIFDITMNYCMAYRPQILSLYKAHPDPLEYAKVLVYKK